MKVRFEDFRNNCDWLNLNVYDTETKDYFDLYCGKIRKRCCEEICPYVKR